MGGYVNYDMAYYVLLFISLLIKMTILLYGL